jgi:hypothetical protein
MSKTNGVTTPVANDVRYLYFGRHPAETHKHKGVVAVAYRQPPPEADELDIGVAFCSPHDTFCKSRSRAIASGRLTCQKRDTAVTIPVTPGEDLHKTVTDFLSSDTFTKSKKVPRWLSKVGGVASLPTAPRMPKLSLVTSDGEGEASGDKTEFQSFSKSAFEEAPE